MLCQSCVCVRQVYRTVYKGLSLLLSRDTGSTSMIAYGCQLSLPGLTASDAGLDYVIESSSKCRDRLVIEIEGRGA
jgi:hypothetical protein